MHSHYSKIAACLVLAVSPLFATSVSASAINHVETHTHNVDGVIGLQGISDVAVSADGKFVYTASYRSDALSVFERNPATGRLTYRSTTTGVTTAFSVDVSPDNKSVYAASPTGSVIYAFSRDIATGALTSVGSASGSPTGGFVSVSVSPDSKTVFGVGGQPSGLVAFSRNMDTGAIARVADYADNTNGHALGQVFHPSFSPIKNIAFSANGQFAYVTSTGDNAISLFSRDTATGALTQQAVYVDDVAGVDGLQEASSVKITPDGDYLYVSGQGESSIAIFRVDPTDGSLTYIDKVTHGVDGVTHLQGVRSLAISPDGRYFYASAISSASVTAFDRDPATGLLTVNTVVTEGVGGVTGLVRPSGMATDPFNRHLYVAGQDSDSLVVFALPTPVVRLSAADTTAAFNGAARILDPLLQVFDADSTHLTSATVSISAGFVSTDVLSATAVPGIVASYNAGTGVLSLTGSAPLADYQAVLRTLSFRSGADPSVVAGGFSSRTITIAVSDGDNASALASIGVKVGPQGAAAPAALHNVPVDQPWALALLSALVGVLAWRGQRRLFRA
jgi:6-phosphogluconolactonase (cycloisomerase 2 family)